MRWSLFGGLEGISGRKVVKSKKGYRKEMDNENGTLFWITGLSGAGKSTVGELFFAELKKRYSNSILMDGDDIRSILGNFDYSENGRNLAFKHNLGICRWLTSQGINIVMCVVGMRDQYRNEYRRNIKNYREIYLKVSMGELIRRDSKGIYQEALNQGRENVIGINMSYDEPVNAELVICNEGEITAEKAAEIMIKKYLN